MAMMAGRSQLAREEAIEARTDVLVLGAELLVEERAEDVHLVRKIRLSILQTVEHASVRVSAVSHRQQTSINPKDGYELHAILDECVVEVLVRSETVHVGIGDGDGTRQVARRVHESAVERQY